MKFIGLTLFVLIAISAQCQSGTSATSLPSRLPLQSAVANALYCMERENPPTTTNESDRRTSRIRYIYGVVDPNVDLTNELHIMSYDSDKESAWLYELLIERNGNSGMTLTWINTARLQRKDEQWTVQDTLGGVYSYQRIDNLVERILHQKEQVVSIPSKRPQNLVCKSR
jgi:hypothetical protein